MQQTPGGVKYARTQEETSNGHIHLLTNGHIGDVSSLHSTPLPIDKINISTKTPPRNSDDENDDMIDEGKIRSNFIAFRPYIISCVKVTDLIVYYDYFNEELKQRLSQQNKSDPHAATISAFEAIDVLNYPDKFSRLLCALDYAYYPKVVKILKGNIVPVNDKHRKTIKRSFPHIYNRLSTSDAIPFLLADNVINRHDADAIRAIERTQGRGNAIIDLLLILPNRSRKWFPFFIKALIESRQTELAEIIDKEVFESLSVKLEPRNLHGCSLCTNDDVYREACHFCRTCNDYLCNACELSHRKFQPTRQHSVISGEDMNQIEVTQPKQSFFSRCALL